MQSSVTGMLGILNKAGLVDFGPGVYGRLRRANLLFVAFDASPNSVNKAIAIAKEHGIPIINTFDKRELGEPFGYGEISLLAIHSAKGSKKILGLVEKGDTK